MTMELVDSIYVEADCGSIDFQNIPSTGKHLYVHLDMVISGGVYMYINGNSSDATNYETTGGIAQSNSWYGIFGQYYQSNFNYMRAISINAGVGKAHRQIWFPRYSDTTTTSSSNTGAGGGKTWLVRGWNGNYQYGYGEFHAGKYYTSSAINRLYFYGDTSTSIREGSIISIQVLN